MYPSCELPLNPHVKTVLSDANAVEYSNPEDISDQLLLVPICVGVIIARTEPTPT